MNSIKENLAEIQDRIATAAKKAGRAESDVKLIAITKTIEPARINVAIECGVKWIGENKVQEFLSKKAELLDASYHFVGGLQTNKVKLIYDQVELIHSLDRIELAEMLEKLGEKAQREINALIQVNIGREKTKGGVDPESSQAFCEQLDGFKWLKIKGLMAIPPYEEPEIARHYFSAVRELSFQLKREKFNNCEFKELSMGMSEDYKQAIAEGATFVRIGSAIFGKRE